MMDQIIVIGGGGHAKVLIGIIRKMRRFDIVGYTDVSDRGEILGIRWLGDDSVLKKYRTGSAAVGIGKTDKPTRRNQVIDELSGLGFRLPPIISPDAMVNEGVEIGEAAVVFDGAVVNSGAEIGRGVILNTNSTVEHDSSVGDYSHVATGAVICGGVVVGADCFIGAGSVVVHGIKISEGCIIGAGSVVIRDCKASGTYVGNPARKIK